MSLSESNNSDSDYSQLVHELQEFQANKHELIRNLQDIEHQIFYREQQLMQTSRRFGNVATGLKLQAFLPDSDSSNSNIVGNSLLADSKKCYRQRSSNSFETSDDSSHIVNNSPNALVASDDEYIFSMSSMTSPIYDNIQTIDHCHEICNQDELSGSEQTSNGSCPKSSPQCSRINNSIQWQRQYGDLTQDLSDVCDSNQSSTNTTFYDPCFSRNHSTCSVISQDLTRHQSGHGLQLKIDRNPVATIFNRDVDQSPTAHVSRNYKNQSVNRYHSYSGYQNS